MQFRHPLFSTLMKRLREPRRFIQVLAGPRQVGKTTLVHQLMEKISFPTQYGTADETTLKNLAWIDQQWEVGRALLHKGKGPALLVLDEVQKINGWSERVKKLWDQDSIKKKPLKVLLLGSAPLLVQQGLTESLAGRFEILKLNHWSYLEMKQAFDWDLETYLYYGGYPGSAPLISEEERWTQYILDALVETSISRDILLMTRVDKPALLRRLFQLGCEYSGQVLSYQKMLGQLQDAKNTTTLAHYLELLGGAGMVTGLNKFSGSKVRQRGSSPKLQVLNTALMSALSTLSFAEARKQPNFWGRLVESAVGAYLMNGLQNTKTQVCYWKKGIYEVDFVLQKGKKVSAIEVKSGLHKKEILPGIQEFSSTFKPYKKLLVGTGGISLEDFFSTPVNHWLE